MFPHFAEFGLLRREMVIDAIDLRGAPLARRDGDRQPDLRDPPERDFA